MYPSLRSGKRVEQIHRFGESQIGRRGEESRFAIRQVFSVLENYRRSAGRGQIATIFPVAQKSEISRLGILNRSDPGNPCLRVSHQATVKFKREFLDFHN